MNQKKTSNNLVFFNHVLYFNDMPVEKIADIKLESLKIAQKILTNASTTKELIDGATELSNWIRSRD